MSDGQDKSGNLKVTRGDAVPTEDASSQALSEALGSTAWLMKGIVGLLAAAFVASCIFTVNPNEVAIVLRFGSPLGTGPEMLRKQGLHFALPYPIDEIVRVRIGEVQTVLARTAWARIEPADEQAGNITPPRDRDRLNPAADGHVLTADGNIIHVRAALKYRITDPLAYAFRFSSASNLLANALDNAIYHTASTYQADVALYKDQSGFRESVRSRLENWIARSQLGVTVDLLEVQTAAPGFVAEAFEAVTKAEQSRSTKISDAEGEANTIVGKASGEAQAILAGGQVSSNALVQAVTADADAFERQREFFRRDPDLFKRRLLADSMSRVVTNANHVFFLESDELRLLLNRGPQTPPKPGGQGQSTP